MYDREKQNEYQRAWRKTKAGIASMRKYSTSPKGRASERRKNHKQKTSGYLKKFRNSEYQRDRMRKYHLRYKETSHGKKTMYLNKLRQEKKNPLRHSAHKAIWYQVKIGKIPRINTQICKNCLNPAEHYHHYLGYKSENKLKVIPLCFPCHKSIHLSTKNQVG